MFIMLFSLMNYSRITLCALLLSALLSASAEDLPDIQLRGILDLGSDQAFSLTNQAATEGNWFRVGQSFNGYRLQSFDKENKVLTVENGDEKIQLRIAIAEEPLAEDVSSFEERLTKASNIMNLMNFEKMINESMEVQQGAISEMMRQQMSTMGEEIDEEFIQFQSKTFKEMYDEIDWEPIKQGMSEAYAEVFTKDELVGISNFYSTPAGRATIEKMPDIQQKTMQVMIPPMMKASENMQEKISDFFEDRSEASPINPQ